MTADEPLDVRGAAVSECGRRRVNQDAVLLVTLPDGAELAAVADGMGGHAGGEVASTVALATIRAAVEGGADLASAIRAANRAVLDEAIAQPSLGGMGTTVVAVLRRGDTYTIANVGDSRAYRVDTGGIAQLTQDHSFVAEAVRSGQLSAQQAGRSQWRNAVTRAVGTDADVQVDEFGPFSARDPHALLLCTDGLYRTVEDSDLHRAVMEAADPAYAARLLAETAYAAGSDDNISAVLLHFGAAQPVMRIEPATPASAAVPPSTPSQPARAEHVARRRSKPSAGWTFREVAIIFGGVALVILYVVLLRSVF